MIVVCIAVIGLGMSSGMMPDMKELAEGAARENQYYTLMLDSFAESLNRSYCLSGATEPFGMEIDGFSSGDSINNSLPDHLPLRCRKWTRDWG